MEKWQRIMYQPNTVLGKDGKKATACKGHRELAKNAGKEGMVLLKNNNRLLPLKKGQKVALFGKGTFDYVKGGGGSGDVTVEYIVNLYEGLSNLGDRIYIYQDTLDYYKKDIEAQYNNGAVPGMTVEPQLPDEICKKAAAFTDTAIISICRFSGEGWDRKSTYDKKDENNKELFEDGDFYLSHAEKAMVAKVKEYFKNIIVVMNVGGMVDTQWFVEDEQIQSVLMAWQGGMEGGNGAAELLCGIGNPSGKLADTFAKCLEDYPSTYNFHESEDYVNYTEDIYVGYRYFETIPGAAEKVNYPFGYGLSYTTFELNHMKVECQGDTIKVKVLVTNTGDMAGKEVVQVYASAPEGKLGKAKKSLVAFKKTRLIQPGESQRIILEFEASDMASYDDLGKISKSAYVLEKGAYKVFVGTSARDGQYGDFEYIVEEDIVTKQLSEKIAPYMLEERMTSDGTMEKLPVISREQAENYNKDVSAVEKVQMSPYDYFAADGNTPAYRLIPQVNLWREPVKKGRKLLIDVVEGRCDIQEFVGQFTDEELAYLLGGQPNTGVANTFGIGNMPDYGVPSVMTADGPAGLRIEGKCGVNTTAWPCSTMLACTWNEELVGMVGEAAALEVKENNIGVWLTPAINIHRSPLCGRNFEYYSEDPYLAGKLAAAMVRGIQSKHIAATVKHFAFNNKETNRKNSDSRVSERAAREIYLKAFEIIVKEAGPWAIMTSYNIVNGHRTSENKELIEGILREEWGFDGMITTDWWTFGEHFKEAKAGNDLKMPCGCPDRLLEAMEKGILTREDMEKCAINILKLIMKMD